MILKRQKLYSALDPDIIKQFLGRLSGFVHKAKSLHWAADGKDIHEYLDEIWEATYKFQDTVAEGYMGIDGKLDSDIPFLMPNDSNTPEKFIKELEFQVIDYYRLFDDDPKYSGLKGEFESFIQTIEKYKYLFGLCEEKEFSEKEAKKKKGKEVAGVASGSAALLTSGAILKRKGDRLAGEGARKLGWHSKELVNLGYKTALQQRGIDYVGEPLSDKIKNAQREVHESIGKLEKGAVKSKTGKGLLIAGATLPVAYVAHRIKKSKKEKKDDLKKLEAGKMTRAEFVEKYGKKK